MTRGIYLVANRRVERYAANLVYSIRQSGCTLPIALIPFDDDLPVQRDLLAETTLMPVESFPEEGRELLAEISRMWPRTSRGLLRRFLCWYGPFDEFVYSDNDIVALGDWTAYLDHLDGFDLVHADLECTTRGAFNYRDPSAAEQQLGKGAHEFAVTAGHFAARKKENITEIFRRAIDWVGRHPEIPMAHDQAFLHLAILLGPLRKLNLCQSPHDWPSSWAGEYRNTLAVVQRVQGPGRLLHLHYSGGLSGGYDAREDFCYADRPDAGRLRQFIAAALDHWSGLHYLRIRFYRGLKRRWNRLFPKK